MLITSNLKYIFEHMGNLLTSGGRRANNFQKGSLLGIPNSNAVASWTSLIETCFSNNSILKHSPKYYNFNIRIEYYICQVKCMFHNLCPFLETYLWQIQLLSTNNFLKNFSVGPVPSSWIFLYKENISRYGSNFMPELVY